MKMAIKMGNTSAKYEEVREFLDRLKNWLVFLNGYVIYEARPKNEQFMLDMEWTSADKKKEWLLRLVPEDYYEGPDENEMPGQEPVWKFGKRIDGKLCYIKIYMLRKPNVYCISFHWAEHDMYLPLKHLTEKI